MLQHGRTRHVQKHQGGDWSGRRHEQQAAWGGGGETLRCASGRAPLLLSPLPEVKNGWSGHPEV